MDNQDPALKLIRKTQAENRLDAAIKQTRDRRHLPKLRDLRYAGATDGQALVSGGGEPIPARIETNGLLKPGQRVMALSSGSAIAITHKNRPISRQQESGFAQRLTYRLIKYLYSVSNANGEEIFYVGGFQRDAVRIGAVPQVIGSVQEAWINNLGGKDFTLDFKGSEHLASYSSKTKQFTVINVRRINANISGVAAYQWHGHGFWSRSTLQSRTTSTINGVSQGISEIPSFFGTSLGIYLPDENLPINTSNTTSSMDELGVTVNSSRLEVEHIRCDYVAGNQEYIGNVEIARNTIRYDDYSTGQNYINLTITGEFGRVVLPGKTKQYEYLYEYSGFASQSIPEEYEYLPFRGIFTQARSDGSLSIIRWNEFQLNSFRRGGFAVVTPESYTEYTIFDSPNETLPPDQLAELARIQNLLNDVQIINDFAYRETFTADTITINNAINNLRSFAKMSINKISFLEGNFQIVETRNEDYFLPHVNSGFSLYHSSYYPK